MKNSLKLVTLATAVLLAGACAKLDRIEAAPQALSFKAAGESQALAVHGFDQNGKEMEKVEYTFSSANAEVATVDATGLVKAVKSGNTTIDIASGEKSASVSVDVKIPSKIEFGAVSIVGLGKSVPLAAKVLDDAGRQLGDAVTFAVADGKFAEIKDGALTSLAVGSTKITATSGALKTEVEATITLPEFDTLAVTPASPIALKAGGEAQLVTEVKLKDAPVEGVAGAVTFASDKETVATVANGKITAVAKGEALITVSLGDKKAEIKVVVK